MSLQIRLTAIYAILAITAVALLGSAVYVIASERIYKNVDHSLEADARAIEAGLTGLSSPITQREIEIARVALDRQALEGVVFQIRAPDGSVLISSEGWTTPLPFTGARPEGGLSTLEQPGPDQRVLVRPVVRGGQTIAYVETRTSLEVAATSLTAIRNVLIVGGLLVSLLTGLAAFFVAGRAVKPVVAAAELARQIEETADFTQRLPEAHSTREMDQLAETFNRMIARVERMIASQRAFLSDTSHELRRPLTLLRTDLDVLGDPNLPAGERTVVEEEMRSAAESMSTLVKELLVLARSDEQSLRQEPVNLSDLCGAVAATARQLAPQHRIEERIDAGIWVTGDEQALARAVGNVIQNATAYSQAGTRVRLELRRGAGQVRLEVIDEGPGMPPEDVERAFDRFYRGGSVRTSRPEGLGLGLAIVKQVVEAHQGRISIQSEPGKGTSVQMILPAARVLAS